MGAIWRNPGALPFLAAAALPLLLYLIYRWRRRRVPWGAMRFLLAARRESRRRVEFRQIALILLRTALVLCLVLAFARLTLRGGPASLVGSRGGAVVVLLDSSYSMVCQAGRNSRHARAVELARDAVAALRDGDEVTVISFGAKPRTLVKWTSDRALAGRALAAEAPSAEATDLEAAFAAAAEALKASRAGQKTVLLVTDLQRLAWQPRQRSPEGLAAALRKVSSEASVVVADVGDDGATDVALVNLSVDDPAVAVGLPVRVRATVANRTAAAREVPGELVSEGLPRLSESVRVPAGGRAEVEFRLAFAEPGWRGLEARIPADALAPDNSRFLAAEVRAGIKVLLVDGRPGRELFGGQVDFLAAALQPEAAADGTRASPIRTRTVTAAALEAETLVGEDLVVLADVPSLGAAAAGRLESYVRAGGAVLVFPGSDAEPGLYNREYWRGGEGFLAAPLGDVIEPAAPGTALDLARSTHPVTAHLREARYGDVSAGRVTRYLSVGGRQQAVGGEERAAANPGSSAYRLPPTAHPEVLLAYADGAPFLVERALGAGRALLCTTTAGTDWNDLPVRPFYAPLFQELVRHAAAPPAAPVEVGGAWSRRLPAELLGRTAAVSLPNGAVRQVVPRAAVEGGAPTLSFGETDLPGIYAAEIGGDRVRFAVNVSGDEGVLDRASPEELRGLFPDFRFRAAAGSESAREELVTALAGRDLAWPLLWLALLAFLAESFLTWRWSAGRGMST